MNFFFRYTSSDQMNYPKKTSVLFSEGIEEVIKHNFYKKQFLKIFEIHQGKAGRGWNSRPLSMDFSDMYYHHHFHPDPCHHHLHHHPLTHRHIHNCSLSNNMHVSDVWANKIYTFSKVDKIQCLFKRVCLKWPFVSKNFLKMWFTELFNSIFSLCKTRHCF